MTNLLKLQFRKSLLTFGVIAAALLLSAPLALLIKPAAMNAAEAVDLAMLYWALAGIPLTALILAGIAGADAAREQAALIEQPLPVSQYRLLLSSLAVAMLETAALTLAAWTIMGLALPLQALTGMQKFMYRFYIFALACLSLYGFVLSYAFRNGIAGAALSVTAVIATVLPLVSMSVFQNLAFELIPLRLLKPAIVVLVFAGGALAIRLLSAVGDRKVRRTAGNMSAVFLLLAVPALVSFVSLAWLNMAARKVVVPVRYRFSGYAAADAYLYAARDRKEAFSHLLVQKPFYGEVFLIDRSGKRSVIDTGGETRGTAFTYLFPNLTFANGEVITGSGGEKWVLYMPAAAPHRLLRGNMATGFKDVEPVNRPWTSRLLGGREPGLIDRREDGYYYAALPPRGGYKWSRVSPANGGYLKFLYERLYREGGAAVFRKDGKTLEYRGRRWTVPGAMDNGLPVTGVALADGLNFLVPAKTKDGYATYICRPSGKAEPIWPDYFRTPINVSVTPDGSVWGVTLTTVPAAGDPEKTAVRAKFGLLMADGSVHPSISTDRILERTGLAGSYGEITPLRAQAGHVWFNAGDRYLVRAAVGAPADLKAWRFPKVVNNRAGLVSASYEGVFIAAADGVYFMDWDGKTKKIY